MDKIEAYRRKVMHDLGWLGKYEYDSLSICDQLYINEKVEEFLIKEKAHELLSEANIYLENNVYFNCPCCGYPRCGHDHPIKE